MRVLQELKGEIRPLDLLLCKLLCQIANVTLSGRRTGGVCKDLGPGTQTSTVQVQTLHAPGMGKSLRV